MNNLKRYFYIFLALFISGTLVVSLSNTVFLNDSPLVRPNLDMYLIAQVKNMFGSAQSQIASLFLPADTVRFENIPLKMVTKGVYAGQSEKGVSTILFKENEMDMVEYTFTVKGKEVKIRVPKGQSPPSQEVMELIH